MTIVSYRPFVSLLQRYRYIQGPSNYHNYNDEVNLAFTLANTVPVVDLVSPVNLKESLSPNIIEPCTSCNKTLQ